MQYSLMLTRVVIVMIAVNEKNILVVKVIHLDKFLPEQSSPVGHVQETFLFCEFCFVNDSKTTVKKWKKLTETKLYTFWNNLIFVKKRTKMRMRQKFLGG